MSLRYIRLGRGNFIYSYSSRAAELLFTSGLFIYISTLIFDMSIITYTEDGSLNAMGFMMKVLRYMCYAMMICKILYCCDVEYNRIALLICSAGVIGLSFITSHNSTVVFYFLFILAAKGMYDRSVIRTAILSQSFAVLTIVLLSRIGIITDYITHNDYRTRHYLGFRWATTSALIYLFIVFEYIYLRRGILRIVDFVVINCFGGYLYYMTDSRMVFFICLASSMFFTVFGRLIAKDRESKYFRYLMIIAPEVIAAGAIYIHKIFVDQGLMAKLDVFLSRRLRFGHKAIVNYGISLFGKRIQWVGHGLGNDGDGVYNYVDCSYLNMAIEYGALFLAVILAVYSYIMYKAYKTGQHFIAWIVLFILVLSITESRLLNFAFNPFTLLTFAVMVSRGGGDTKTVGEGSE